MRYPKTEKYSYEEWNDCLRSDAAEFAKAHEDVTMTVYSSWETFTRVLNDPAAYGFKKGEEKKPGSIWVDHIHPTSQMHDEIAKDMITLLQTMEDQST